MQKFRLDWNYHSNAIEGNTLTQGETRVFLLYGLTAKGKPLRDHLDLKGHDEAIDYMADVVRQNDPLTEAALRELHKLLLGKEPYRVPAQTSEGQATRKEIVPGRYKAQPNHVETVTGKVHYYATPEETPARMHSLMNWYHRVEDEGTLHPLVVATEFHHQFTAIHPFDDGNGRMARILTNLMLMRHGYPPLVVRKENREAYLYALALADEEDLSDLLEFFAAALLDAMQLYLRGARGEDLGELGDFDKRIALLTQQLESEEETAHKGLQAQADLFDNLLRPLFSTIYARLEKVDPLFARVDSRLHGYTSGATLITFVGIGDSRLARMLDLFQRAAGYELYFIGLEEAWEGFRKDLSKSLSFTVSVKLERRSIKIDASVLGLEQSQRLQIPRDVPFKQEDVDHYAAQLLDLLSQGLEKLSD